MTTETIRKTGFHSIRDYQAATHPGLVKYQQETEFVYTFENFFHPFVGELIEQLNRESLPGIFDPAFQAGLRDDFFTDFYTPQTGSRVKIEHFPKEIDVTEGGPYAGYNWEFFFHLPLTIAVHLSKNQRFAEAQRWFHFIFDPTANDTSVAVPQRYWKFIAFRNGGAGRQIDELLALLSKPAGECTAEELDQKAKILAGYEAIKNKPFQPHAVARTRHLAYRYGVVMKYLDNLIAWSDHLFRQDTLESINEATQLYVLAANILGRRPEKVPLKGRARPKTFAQLRAQGLDPMGNALVELEGAFPFNLGVPTEGEGAAAAAPLFGIGRTLYFCIPRNDRLLGYWDTVADRLFKLRHCMNLAGVVRPLALFDPPLDPGMLVKAAAAGIDIGAIVAGLNQPPSPVRVQIMIQKALELCAEVRNLGSALLSAIEKRDGERLALLRQGHEIKIQQLQQEVRFLQWKQAEEATQSLLKTRAIALERYKSYLRLLGRAPDSNLAPDILPLDRRELTEQNFDEAYAALVNRYEQEVPVQAYPRLSLAGGESPAGASGAEGPGRLSLITGESDELNHLTTARDLGLAASIVDATGSALVFIPDTNIDLHYWGLGGTVKMNIGTAILKVLEITAKVLQMGAAWEREQAGIVSRTAAHTRRADEWILQANLSARELSQIGRQIIASLIAEQIAHREYENVRQQIEHSQEIDLFLREKFSNAELYAWMQGEISRLYYESYRFAFDTARKAERTMKQELMRPEADATDYVKFNYWDGGRKGLLSGEALYLDLKRMELAYHENNRREFELTKHISLRQLNPLALLLLKATGTCEVTVPEWLLDMDCPGHYMRRIKSVSLSIPSVAGPYTSVNCTLSLLRSSLRKSSLLKDGEYARQGSEDDRFVDYFGAIQSVVTSSGTNDSGMFEANLRDERFLPFEGAGVESTWKLELPAAFRQFDYHTISDVILHVRYTARQGGDRDKAIEHLEAQLAAANTSGLALLLSLAHDFPSEWSRFVSGGANFAAVIKRDYFPYITKGRSLTMDALRLHAVDAEDISSVAPAGLDLTALSEALTDEDAFDLSLPEGEVLARDKQAIVFVSIQYSVTTVP